MYYLGNLYFWCGAGSYSPIAQEFVREFAPRIQDLEAVKIAFRATPLLPLTMQTASLCPREGGALCVREIRLLPLPEGAANATPPAGRGAERGRFLSWPGGLRRRLSARRYRVPPAGAAAGRTEPGWAGPGRADPQGREAAVRAACRRVPSPWGRRAAGAPHPRGRPFPRHPRGVRPEPGSAQAISGAEGRRCRPPQRPCALPGGGRLGCPLWMRG